jgi:hypothetical protein
MGTASNAYQFDSLEWVRDELLIQADEWAEIMAGAEARQAQDIRLCLQDLVPLRNNPRLSIADRYRVGRTIDMLRGQLLALRRGA